MAPNTWVSLLLVASLWPIQAPAPAQETAVLRRPVALSALKGTSAVAAITLLAEAHVPGGVISLYNRCTAPSDQRFSLQETTLEQGLDYVSTIDSSRKWNYQEGLIIVGYEVAEKTILKTTLHDVDIDPNDALSLSTERLLGTVELREQVKREGLLEMSTALGFSAISRNGTAPPEKSRTSKPKHFPEITMVQALNFLASTKGMAVWHYEQFVCGNRTSFRLSWVVSSE